MIADPCSDFIIRLKNAYQAGHRELNMPSTQLIHHIAKLMSKHAFIGKVTEISTPSSPKKQLKIVLIYPDGKPALQNVKRLSRPGRRLYVAVADIPWVSAPNALIIISTSSGIMSHRQAVSRKLGGELIAEIW